MHWIGLQNLGFHSQSEHPAKGVEVVEARKDQEDKMTRKRHTPSVSIRR